MNRKAWLLFALVSVLWGIPYLLIKIAVSDLSAPVVVVARTGIAAAILLPFAVRSGALRGMRQRLGSVVLLTLTHITGPFLLITYGETHIPSSLAALLIATQPVLIAILAIRGNDASEKVRGWRAVGLGVGLAGVVCVVGLDTSGDRYRLLGAGMVLLAALGYAAATLIVKRRFADVPPLGVVASTMTLNTVVLLPVALLTAPTKLPDASALGAVALLGVLCTATAFLAFYRLIAEAGAGRASLITYVDPIIAVLLGVAVLHEALHASALAGFALVLIGSWLSTRRAAPAPAPAEAVAEAVERTGEPVPVPLVEGQPTACQV